MPYFALKLDMITKNNEKLQQNNKHDFINSKK